MRFPSQRIFFGFYITSSKKIVNWFKPQHPCKADDYHLVLQHKKFEDQRLDYRSKLHELAQQV